MDYVIGNPSPCNVMVGIRKVNIMRPDTEEEKVGDRGGGGGGGGKTYNEQYRGRGSALSQVGGI